VPVPVPTRREDLTPEWLTAFLQTRHPDVVVDDLEIIGSTQGAATRVRIKPTYARGHEGGLPPVLFIKTSLTKRMLVADPHMYLTEVRFYERLRDSLDCETPRVFACVLEDETYRFAVAIEDLSLRSASFPSAVSGLTADDVAPLMTTMARLHAPNWGHQDLEQRYSWLETATSGKSATWWVGEGTDQVRVELEVPYKREVFEGGGQPVERLFAAIEALQRVNDTEPRTVTHGDTHIGNCYLLPDGTGGLLDWQLMRVANWGNDVAYTVMTALDVEERRKGERELLQIYLDELRRLGVAAPDWNHAWDLYRSQMVWGIYAFLVTPTAMYDQQRLEAIIHRCVVAAEDLGTYESLGV
jgi:aminoglycoside phosphotransferase (APT) family kinase protein